MIDDEQRATLATIAANQRHMTSALEALSDAAKEARVESATRGATLHDRITKGQQEATAALNSIATTSAITAEKLSDHMADDQGKFRLVWRILLGIGGLGGTVAGAASMLGGL